MTKFKIGDKVRKKIRHIYDDDYSYTGTVYHIDRWNIHIIRDDGVDGSGKFIPSSKRICWTIDEDNLILLESFKNFREEVERRLKNE